MNVSCLCIYASVLTWCVFPFWSLTLEPEFAEETYVELSETETEDPATCDPSSTYPGKGGNYITLYSSQLAFLDVFITIA